MAVSKTHDLTIITCPTKGAQKDLMANMPGKTEVDPEEEKRQQEQLQAMDQAEEERKRKWQKQENQREGMRAGIRDKVRRTVTFSLYYGPQGATNIHLSSYI